MEPNSDNYYEVIFNALQYKSVEKITDVAYSILNMPIVVVDSNFVVLAKYPLDVQEDEQWDANVIGEQIKLRYISTFSQDGQFDAYDNSELPVLFDWGHYKDMPRLSAAILSGRQRLGYICALTTGCKVEDWHYDALAALAKACSFIMGESSWIFGNASVLSALLYGLLNGSKLNSLDVSSTNMSISDYMTAPYMLICAQPRKSIDAVLEAYMGHRFFNAFDALAYSVFDKRLYVLISSVSETSSFQKILDTIISSLKEWRFDCGFSRTFHSLENFNLYKWQAESALKVGRKTRADDAIFYFDDMYCDIIYDTLDESLPQGALELPIINTIKQYDKENNTEYFITLKTYLIEHQDKQAAAKSLHIHRNTLRYRLSKIDELFEVDFNDRALNLVLGHMNYLSRQNKNNQANLNNYNDD